MASPMRWLGEQMHRHLIVAALVVVSFTQYAQEAPSSPERTNVGIFFVSGQIGSQPQEFIVPPGADAMVDESDRSFKGTPTTSGTTTIVIPATVANAVFQRCTFLDDVVVEGGRDASILFAGCVFEKSLSIRRTAEGLPSTTWKSVVVRDSVLRKGASITGGVLIGSEISLISCSFEGSAGLLFANMVLRSSLLVVQDCAFQTSLPSTSIELRSVLVSNGSNVTFRDVSSNLGGTDLPIYGSRIGVLFRSVNVSGSYIGYFNVVIVSHSGARHGNMVNFGVWHDGGWFRDSVITVTNATFDAFAGTADVGGMHFPQEAVNTSWWFRDTTMRPSLELFAVATPSVSLINVTVETITPSGPKGISLVRTDASSQSGSTDEANLGSSPITFDVAGLMLSGRGHLFLIGWAIRRLSLSTCNVSSVRWILLQDCRFTTASPSSSYVDGDQTAIDVAGIFGIHDSTFFQAAPTEAIALQNVSFLNAVIDFRNLDVRLVTVDPWTGFRVAFAFLRVNLSGSVVSFENVAAIVSTNPRDGYQHNFAVRFTDSTTSTSSSSVVGGVAWTTMQNTTVRILQCRFDASWGEESGGLVAGDVVVERTSWSVTSSTISPSFELTTGREFDLTFSNVTVDSGQFKGIFLQRINIVTTTKDSWWSTLIPDSLLSFDRVTVAGGSALTAVGFAPSLVTLTASRFLGKKGFGLRGCNFFPRTTVFVDNVVFATSVATTSLAFQDVNATGASFVFSRVSVQLSTEDAVIGSRTAFAFIGAALTKSSLRFAQCEVYIYTNPIHGYMRHVAVEFNDATALLGCDVQFEDSIFRSLNGPEARGIYSLDAVNTTWSIRRCVVSSSVELRGQRGISVIQIEHVSLDSAAMYEGLLINGAAPDQRDDDSPQATSISIVQFNVTGVKGVAITNLQLVYVFVDLARFRSQNGLAIRFCTVAPLPLWPGSAAANQQQQQPQQNQQPQAHDLATITVQSSEFNSTAPFVCVAFESCVITRTHIQLSDLNAFLVLPGDDIWRGVRAFVRVQGSFLQGTTLSIVAADVVVSTPPRHGLHFNYGVLVDLGSVLCQCSVSLQQSTIVVVPLQDGSPPAVDVSGLLGSSVIIKSVTIRREIRLRGLINVITAVGLTIREGGLRVAVDDTAYADAAALYGTADNNSRSLFAPWATIAGHVNVPTTSVEVLDSTIITSGVLPDAVLLEGVPPIPRSPRNGGGAFGTHLPVVSSFIIARCTFRVASGSSGCSIRGMNATDGSIAIRLSHFVAATSLMSALSIVDVQTPTPGALLRVSLSGNVYGVDAADGMSQATPGLAVVLIMTNVVASRGSKWTIDIKESPFVVLSSWNPSIRSAVLWISGRATTFAGATCSITLRNNRVIAYASTYPANRRLLSATAATVTAVPDGGTANITIANTEFVAMDSPASEPLVEAFLNVSALTLDRVNFSNVDLRFLATVVRAPSFQAAILRCVVRNNAAVGVAQLFPQLDVLQPEATVMEIADCDHCRMDLDCNPPFAQSVTGSLNSETGCECDCLDPRRSLAPRCDPRLITATASLMLKPTPTSSLPDAALTRSLQRVPLRDHSATFADEIHPMATKSIAPGGEGSTTAAGSSFPPSTKAVMPVSQPRSRSVTMRSSRRRPSPTRSPLLASPAVLSNTTSGPGVSTTTAVGLPVAVVSSLDAATIEAVAEASAAVTLAAGVAAVVLGGSGSAADVQALAAFTEACGRTDSSRPSATTEGRSSRVAVPVPLNAAGEYRGLAGGLLIVIGISVVGMLVLPLVTRSASYQASVGRGRGVLASAAVAGRFPVLTWRAIGFLFQSLAAEAAGLLFLSTSAMAKVTGGLSLLLLCAFAVVAAVWVQQRMTARFVPTHDWRALSTIPEGAPGLVIPAGVWVPVSDADAVLHCVYTRFRWHRRLGGVVIVPFARAFAVAVVVSLPVTCTVQGALLLVAIAAAAIATSAAAATRLPIALLFNNVSAALSAFVIVGTMPVVAFRAPASFAMVTAWATLGISVVAIVSTVVTSGLRLLESRWRRGIGMLEDRGPDFHDPGAAGSPVSVASAGTAEIEMGLLLPPGGRNQVDTGSLAAGLGAVAPVNPLTPYQR